MAFLRHGWANSVLSHVKKILFNCPDPPLGIPSKVAIIITTGVWWFQHTSWKPKKSLIQQGSSALRLSSKVVFDPAENSLLENLTSHLSLFHHHEPEGDSMHRAGASR
jgi:hypothetical protein